MLSTDTHTTHTQPTLRAHCSKTPPTVLRTWRQATALVATLHVLSALSVTAHTSLQSSILSTDTHPPDARAPDGPLLSVHRIHLRSRAALLSAYTPALSRGVFTRRLRRPPPPRPPLRPSPHLPKASWPPCAWTRRPSPSASAAPAPSSAARP